MVFPLIGRYITKEYIQRDWIIVPCRVKWRETEMPP